MLSSPDVSTKTLVPPSNLVPYTTGIFASLDCLFNKTPFSKSSNSLVPKSGISGVLGLNTQAMATVAINLTTGLRLEKKLNAELIKPPKPPKKGMVMNVMMMMMILDHLNLYIHLFLNTSTMAT